MLFRFNDLWIVYTRDQRVDNRESATNFIKYFTWIIHIHICAIARKKQQQKRELKEYMIVCEKGAQTYVVC